MSFGRPEFLWLLLLLIVPLVLYLLPLPRRRVPSSVLYLWERFLASQRFGGVSDRLRRALGFAMLAIILTSLILAAADLSIGSSATKAPRVVVLIDSSASMSAKTAAGDRVTNFKRAQDAAEQFVRSLDASTPTAVAMCQADLRVIEPMPADGASARPKADLARIISHSAASAGRADLKRLLEEAYNLWGSDARTQVYVFSDGELPQSPWLERAHAWIAPQGGDNAGIIALSCQRRGKQINIQYTVANYGSEPRSINGDLFVGGKPEGKLEAVTVAPGESARRAVTIDEPASAAIEVRIAGGDCLACDDSAFAFVPALDDMKVNVIWPQAQKRNEYVWAVLTALQGEGVVGPVTEGAQGAAPVTVYVNQVPEQWPDGDAIVLYPLKSGAVEVTGLHPETVTVDRQAEHPLLADVDLRGLEVKGAVQAPVPPWASPLAWADQLPLAWAGQTGKTRVLWLGVPVMPSGSRLPLVTGFPVLMRNSLQWMLPQPAVNAVQLPSRLSATGETLVASAEPAKSPLSADESDLRRKSPVQGETFDHRRPLAMILVVLAMALLPLEWTLFHGRVTE